MPRCELTIAGLGGQGSILAGVILGQAAVASGLYAVQTQAYSSELRGGFAAAWVIVDQEPILFPRVTRPDLLLAQAQDAIDRFLKTLKPEGILIFDSDMIPGRPEASHSFSLPATSLARHELKTPQAANMLMLGALGRVTGLVAEDHLRAAIAAAVPPAKKDVNLRAFDLGRERVKEV